MRKPVISPGTTHSIYQVIPNKKNEEETYIISPAIQKMENLHIVFWLFKDISWCIICKSLGIIMIFPTLIVSIIIAWRTRQYISELCHNVAITLWILANSYWMISEFFEFDSTIITGNITCKRLTLIPFGLGVLILGAYYFYFKKNIKTILKPCKQWEIN